MVAEDVVGRQSPIVVCLLAPEEGLVHVAESRGKPQTFELCHRSENVTSGTR